MGLDKDRLWFILNAGNLPQQSLDKCSNDGILMGPYKDRLCFFRKCGITLRQSLSPPPAYFAGVSLCSLPGEVLGVAEAQLHEPRHYDHDQGEHLRIREVVLHL